MYSIIIEHMTWHRSYDMIDEVMELHSIYVGLYTNRFNPFGLFVVPYSCCPVILTVYNLPSGMYIRPEFIFLSMVIPGHNSPGRNIDVHLRSLIDKLK
jgi:hypothetical protein